MFDLANIFQYRYPKTYRDHSYFSWCLIGVMRVIWREKQYKQLRKQNSDKQSGELASLCLDSINYIQHISDEDLQKIPKKGPLIIVANHPNPVDTCCYLAATLSVRRDVKIIAYEGYKFLDFFEGAVIPVEPETKKFLEGSFKMLTAYLENDCAIFIYPAGVYSELISGELTDAPWADGFFRFALHHNVPILPVYFDSPRKGLFGYLHSTFRPFHWLYIRGFPYTYRNGRMNIHVRDCIDPVEIDKRYDTIDEKVGYCRDITYYGKSNNT